MILPWTALRPSTRERRWRLAAVAAALAVTGLLLWAAITGDPRRPAVLWAALAVAAIGLVLGVRRKTRATARELCIGHHGEILLREAGVQEGPVSRPRCVFRAPWLITLADGTICLPIWPDSLPPDAFRRLWACVRWGRSAGSAHARGSQTTDDSDAERP